MQLGPQSIREVKIERHIEQNMVGPQDGGFGFDQSKKYTSVENIEEICVQCQAGQHKKCMKNSIYSQTIQNKQINH